VKKHTLKVTAKYADRVDLGFLPTIDEYRRKTRNLRALLHRWRRDFAEIERACWPSGQIIVRSSQSEVDQLASQMKPEGTPLQNTGKAL